MPDPTPESRINASVLNAALHAPANALPLQLSLINNIEENLRSLSHGTSQDNDWGSINKLDFVSNLAYSEISILWILYSNKFCSFSSRYNHIMQSPVCFRFLSCHFLLILCDKCLAEVLLIGLIVTLVGIFSTLGMLVLCICSLRIFVFFMLSSIRVSFFPCRALRWLLRVLRRLGFISYRSLILSCWGILLAWSRLLLFGL